MKKRAWVAVITILTMLVMMLTPTRYGDRVKAASAVTVRLHYQREDGNYDGWNIWSWPSTAGGSCYQFTGEDDFGKVAEYTMEMPDGDLKIGFIVRYSTSDNEWAGKDGDSDRFVELSSGSGSTVDIYVTSGKEEFEVKEDTSNVVPAIISAKSIDDTTIEFSLSLQPEGDVEATLSYKDGTPVEIAQVNMKEKKGTIKLKEAYKVSEKLKLSIKDFGEFTVAGQNIFSTSEFENEFAYDGDDLGATWSKDETTFRVWAPTADAVSVNIYKEGDSSVDDLVETIPMQAGEKGVWSVTKTGDCNGMYYTYLVQIDETTNEAVDPYARAVGVNGNRSMVIDLSSTNPEGWENDKRVTPQNITDANIYELHVRDFSIDESSGMQNKGKYLAFTESGTKSASGNVTGLEYIKDLGITHIQLMPVFDYATVDESKLDEAQFNWGYDPKNYNVPEGSYSTDPYKGEVRVNEFKQMIESIHNNGLGVVMDVVYNHTSTTDWCYNKIVPDYCYRKDENDKLCSGSGCGNDIASERAMMRKYIVDSVVYWAKEYHIDGFRFDLVGLTDVDTINAIRAALNEIDPTIMMYGEGWTLATIPSKEGTELCVQSNSGLVPGMGFFSDNIRDGLKGSVFEEAEKGYVTGATDRLDKIKDCVLGTAVWSTNPSQAINYTSCHDNNTLWDKIAISNASDSEEDRLRENLLAAAIVYTAQGVPFIQAGEEMLRTKTNEDGTFNSNSYNATDAVNSLKWDRYKEYADIHDYYKGLMEFRKEHAGLRMVTKEEVDSSITFQDGLDDNVIAYTIAGGANGETSEGMFVVYNPNKAATTVTLPEGNWDVYISGMKAGTTVLSSESGSVSVEPISCMVLVKSSDTKELQENTAAPTEQAKETTSSNVKSTSKTPVVMIVIVAVVAIVGVIFVITRKKK